MEKPHEALLTHFDIPVPERVEIKVVEESAQVLYMVLPFNPEELTGELTDDVLNNDAGGYRYNYVGCDINNYGSVWDNK